MRASLYTYLFDESSRHPGSSCCPVSLTQPRCCRPPHLRPPPKQRCLLPLDAIIIIIQTAAFCVPAIRIQPRPSPDNDTRRLESRALMAMLGEPGAFNASASEGRELMTTFGEPGAFNANASESVAAISACVDLCCLLLLRSHELDDPNVTTRLRALPGDGGDS